MPQKVCIPCIATGISVYRQIISKIMTWGEVHIVKIGTKIGNFKGVPYPLLLPLSTLAANAEELTCIVLDFRNKFFEIYNKRVAKKKYLYRHLLQ